MAELLGLVPGWQEQALSVWVLNSVVPIVIKMAGQRPFHGTAGNGGMLISYRESLCCEFFVRRSGHLLLRAVGQSAPMQDSGRVWWVCPQKTHHLDSHERLAMIGKSRKVACACN